MRWRFSGHTMLSGDKGRKWLSTMARREGREGEGGEGGEGGEEGEGGEGGERREGGREGGEGGEVVVNDGPAGRKRRRRKRKRRRRRRKRRRRETCGVESQLQLPQNASAPSLPCCNYKAWRRQNKTEK